MRLFAQALVGLSLDFYAFPEGNISFNILGGIFGGWVIPSGILIDLPIYFNVVVAGSALPRTAGVSVAFLEILLVD